LCTGLDAKNIGGISELYARLLSILNSDLRRAKSKAHPMVCDLVNGDGTRYADLLDDAGVGAGKVRSDARGAKGRGDLPDGPFGDFAV
jgi:hypothetical protein